MRMVTLLMIALHALTGCATAFYKKPEHLADTSEYDVVIDQSFDETWKKLINFSASTFFSIDNFEKDSGLITLSFGSSKPENYITGGQWRYNDPQRGVNYFGEYVTYQSRHSGARLTGKMNIAVIEQSANQTRVKVSARYIFDLGRGEVFAFNTGECDTHMVSNSAPNIGRVRMICPTYNAENSVIQALK